MSRKTRRNQPSTAEQATPASRFSRTSVLVGSIVALLLVVVAGALLYNGERGQSSQSSGAAEPSALASVDSPALGDPSAKVHVVEFLDPACETCAQFFPLVKQRMAENPNKIRLSVRHLAFHNGSDYVVRVLEASRKQDKYWQTLEALLNSQAQWAPNHRAQPDLVLQAISGVGLHAEQLLADMNAPEVAQRMQRDRDDGLALKVTATPEYFVNGRPMPSFGEQQLQDLISEALQSVY